MLTTVSKVLFHLESAYCLRSCRRQDSSQHRRRRIKLDYSWRGDWNRAHQCLGIGGIPDVLYLLRGVRASCAVEDGGKTWHNISAKLPDRFVVAWAIDGARGDILYVATAPV